MVAMCIMWPHTHLYIIWNSQKVAPKKSNSLFMIAYDHRLIMNDFKYCNFTHEP
jgi:hypothetical protein